MKKQPCLMIKEFGPRLKILVSPGTVKHLYESQVSHQNEKLEAEQNRTESLWQFLLPPF